GIHADAPGLVAVRNILRHDERCVEPPTHYRHGAAPDEVLPDDVIVLRHGDPILDLHPPGRIVNGHVGLAIEARIQIAGRRAYADAQVYLRLRPHLTLPIDRVPVDGIDGRLAGRKSEVHRAIAQQVELSIVAL